MAPDSFSDFLVQIISSQEIFRSKNLESKLREIGLNFQISPGVILTDKEYKNGSFHSLFFSKLLCQRDLRIGEVGCALAHRNAITNFLNSDYKFGIVFEDDVEVIADFDFNAISKLFDADMPMIVALGWSPGFAIANSQQNLLIGDPIELATSPTGTFAYAINRSAAELMVGASKKIIDLADWPVYALNKVNFYATYSPWVTTNHDPKLSMIGQRANPAPKNSIAVLVGRIKLLTNLVLLILLSKTTKLNLSSKQVIHRLLIRDFLYKYGISQVDEKSTKNEVIPFPLKYEKLLGFLKVD